METNPYAPPKSVVADLSSTGLKHGSVVVMVLLTFVTFGLYFPIWFFSRLKALNQLDSPRKLRPWPFAVLIAWFVVQLCVGIATSGLPGVIILDDGPRMFFSFVQMGFGILMLIQSFVVKDILEDHLAGPDGDVPGSILTDVVRLSGLLTFFFQIFYLQYVINKYVAGSKPAAV